MLFLLNNNDPNSPPTRMAEDDLMHPQYERPDMPPRQNGTNAKLNANFKKESKSKSHHHNTSSGGRAAVCKVVLLDGEEFECQVDVSCIL